ncbi:hypothetical protein C8Q76DRAFT_791314 [Earliella scabrosa]|nr:hypothetical protein C8Q76DRAFT_791314 [Earliella scabrosa]
MDTSELDISDPDSEASSPSVDRLPLETPTLAAQLPLVSTAAFPCSFSTGHLATDASCYFPTLSSSDYLKVSSPSFYTPRKQEVNRDFGIPNVTRKPFKLQLAASSSPTSNGRRATIRERRQAAGLDLKSVDLGLGIGPQWRQGPPEGHFRPPTELVDIMFNLEAEEAA